eukprot:c18015_g1_i2 orf=684-2744(+)
MDAYTAAVTDMSKGKEIQQDDGPKVVVDCCTLIDSFLSSFPNEELGAEKGVCSAEKLDVSETVVDIDVLSSIQDSDSNLHPFHEDLAKDCYGAHMWSSCSQRTFQGEVSLSVGEGTYSSEGHQELLQQHDGEFIGASRDVREGASSEASIGERCNRSSHGQGFHDDYSAGGVHVPDVFGFAAQYPDCGAQVLLDQGFARSEDVIAAVDGLESAHLFSEVDGHVRDDEEVYSGHASDPGCYAREALKMSSGAPEDGSTSPPMGETESNFLQFAAARDTGEGASVEAGDEKVGLMPQNITSELHSSNQGVLHDDRESSFSRVKEWINSIQQSDMDFGGEEQDFVTIDKESSSAEPHRNGVYDALVAPHSIDHATTDHAFANAAVRSLHPSSTVAHISGIGLREVPSLGMFSSLRALNLSANLIAHVPVGCLPRSLHSLDLSRNRIAQIEGFRELTRLRVLNLSHNRISRIGHGLANCTLIKELYLAGNKIGEVEGLHRLLKLAVLDLSFNKLTTSKALGQLAANYGSLLAVNLLGNPILTNFSEEQIRKLITALAPHVTYLNRQPIKVISVREAALDSVARAALGTSQRYSKSRDAKAARKPSGAQPSSIKKKPPPYQHSRHSDKKLASASSSGYHQHHHHHHSKAIVTGQGTEHTASLKALGGFQNLALDTGKLPIHRSRSAGLLQE